MKILQLPRDKQYICKHLERGEQTCRHVVSDEPGGTGHETSPSRERRAGPGLFVRPAAVDPASSHTDHSPQKFNG